MTRPKKDKEPIDRAQSLAGIPVLNEGVKIVDTDDGGVRVTVRVERGPGFLSRLRPPVMERQVKLDDLGAFVLRRIDGETSMGEIINAFAENYRVNRREAELSCVAFVKSLASRYVVSIVIKSAR